ncbi:MAG TPA: Gx transporter family protein [Mariprofundaceae bacterium]|nr:Gx transporter family protein [Mariprofundaceae bacterium]
MSDSAYSIPRPSLADLETKTRWLTLLMLAIGLHVFEAVLPSLGPWFKPGLANLVTLLAMVMIGPRAAFSLAIGRVVIGGFFIGTLFTPTFIISLSAGLVSALVMVLAWQRLPGISLIGVSLLGALAHMLAQFWVVETLFIHQPAIYYMLPPLLLLSTVTGWINGALARYIVARLTHE